MMGRSPMSVRSAEDLRPPRRRPAGLFTGEPCEVCPVASRCGAVGTDDACGDRSEYATGLHPAQVPTTRPDEFDLPATTWRPVPSLPAAVAICDRLVPCHAVAVRLRESLQDWAWRKTEATVRIAVLLGRDEMLEKVWRQSGQLSADLIGRGVTLVVSPGFSTWWTEPPFASLHAMARSAHLASLLVRQLPTIPTIVWRFRRDLDRWAEWITECEPPMIGLDYGTLRGEDIWRWGITGLEHLVGRLVACGANVPRLFAVGPSTAARVSELFDTWPTAVTVASARPWLAARHGCGLQSDLTLRKVDLRFDDLLAGNIQMFECVVRDLQSAYSAAG